MSPLERDAKMVRPPWEKRGKGSGWPPPSSFDEAVDGGGFVQDAWHVVSSEWWVWKTEA